MKKYVLLIMLSVLITFICNAQNKPVKIIFDTDMLTDPEDVNALCLLHAFADEGEAEILACVANGYEANRASGAAIDVVNTFYHRPDIPIGTYKGGFTNKRSAYTYKLRDHFPHDAPNDDQLPSSLTVYRQTLAGQPDHSVVIVSVGFLLNVKDLLDSKPDKYSDFSGKELIQKKVKGLVVMGGKYPEGREYNFYYGGVAPAAKGVVDNWPDELPILFSGYEIGEFIIQGKNYKNQLPLCPLRTALESAYNIPLDDANNCLNAGRHGWDESAVICAIRGLSHNGVEYWKTQSVGSVLVDCCDGSNTWVSSPDKNQAYLIESMAPDSLASLMEHYVLKSIQNAMKKQ